MNINPQPKWADKRKRPDHKEQLTHNPMKGQLRGFQPWGPECLKCGEPVELTRVKKTGLPKIPEKSKSEIVTRSVRQGFIHEDPKDCMLKSGLKQDDFDRKLEVAALNGEIEMRKPPEADEHAELTDVERAAWTQRAELSYFSWRDSRRVSHPALTDASVCPGNVAAEIRAEEIKPAASSKSKRAARPKKLGGAA